MNFPHSPNSQCPHFPVLYLVSRVARKYEITFITEAGRRRMSCEDTVQRIQDVLCHSRVCMCYVELSAYTHCVYHPNHLESATTETNIFS